MNAARTRLPELVAVDEAITAHAAKMSEAEGYSWASEGTVWNQITGRHEVPGAYAAWCAERDGLATQLRTVEENLCGIICRKCSGRGRIVAFNHRSRGYCFSCGGDGFTAKGRKLHPAPTA